PSRRRWRGLSRRHARDELLRAVEQPGPGRRHAGIAKHDVPIPPRPCAGEQQQNRNAPEPGTAPLPAARFGRRLLFLVFVEEPEPEAGTATRSVVEERHAPIPASPSREGRRVSAQGAVRTRAVAVVVAEPEASAPEARPEQRPAPQAASWRRSWVVAEEESAQAEAPARR